MKITSKQSISQFSSNFHMCFYSLFLQYDHAPAVAATMIATMTPYRPKALPKISTMSIFMKVPYFWASVRAAPAPI